MPQDIAIAKRIANCHPKIKRGMVWCHTCGRSEKVDPERCLVTCWPSCCGETMSIDSPDERAALQSKPKDPLQQLESEALSGKR
jgi:hypothetical protein